VQVVGARANVVRADDADFLYAALTAMSRGSNN